MRTRRGAAPRAAGPARPALRTRGRGTLSQARGRVRPLVRRPSCSPVAPGPSPCGPARGPPLAARWPRPSCPGAHGRRARAWGRAVRGFGGVRGAAGCWPRRRVPARPDGPGSGAGSPGAGRRLAARPVPEGCRRRPCAPGPAGGPGFPSAAGCDPPSAGLFPGARPPRPRRCGPPEGSVPSAPDPRAESWAGLHRQLLGRKRVCVLRFLDEGGYRGLETRVRLLWAPVWGVRAAGHWPPGRGGWSHSPRVTRAAQLPREM